MKKLMYYLCVGTFSLFVACSDDSSDDMEVDCSISDLSVVVSESSRPGCTSLGSLTLAGSGGTTPYSYSINGSDFQTDPTFPDLAAGALSISILDADGCTDMISFTLEADDNSVSFTFETTNSECLDDTGTITVSASGGDGSYQYTLDDGSQQESSSFEGVSAGLHEVSVVDGGGCETSQEVLVKTGVSLSDDIMPLLQAQCTFSGCHNGDNGSDRNWTQKEDVLAMASSIKTRTQNGTMPRSPGVLSQEEIDLIACWVDDGAEDN